eukprot:CAMPEP_0201282300 /NCGR_PEP_ID=MMETSP1317-20130820/5277_1 /ASSEMBLY_ACC=CAM_ASM_000770 /TAXON_ID=187299 /ORGANISM="Undescribed Undescribed, Strain Undescribed" /LENGTH=198 /DNA_ID=CAMNT_0047594549 /DNA_START=121 /DNA_END=717 /DNA_ORIENTATION=-
MNEQLNSQQADTQLVASTLWLLQGAIPNVQFRTLLAREDYLSVVVRHALVGDSVVCNVLANRLIKVVLADHTVHSLNTLLATVDCRQLRLFTRQDDILACLLALAGRFSSAHLNHYTIRLISEQIATKEATELLRVLQNHSNWQEAVLEAVMGVLTANQAVTNQNYLVVLGVLHVLSNSEHALESWNHPLAMYLLQDD